jgi:effector-binding domain-containing protein
MGYEVVTKDLPDQPVLGMRFKTKLANIGGDIGKGYAAIFGYMGKVGAAPAGPPMALYFHMDMTADDIDMELCVPVEREAAGEGDVRGHVLPGGRAASTLYKGPYDGVGPAYEALFAYMKDNSLSPAGPSRELYLTDPSQVENPADNLTEVLFPVK